MESPSAGVCRSYDRDGAENSSPKLDDASGGPTWSGVPVRAAAQARRTARSAGHWAGYGWFMSFGTFLPLLIFLGGYVVHLTLIGAPVARRIYRLGIWTSTLGQDPPGKEKMDAKRAASGKKPLFERIRPYSPPGLLERRGRPVPLAVRVIWFVLVGW